MGNGPALPAYRHMSVGMMVDHGVPAVQCPKKGHRGIISHGIVFGLAVASGLTLFTVPALYLMVEGSKERVARLWTRSAPITAG